jgi:hypothetical protein
VFLAVDPLPLLQIERTHLEPMRALAYAYAAGDPIRYSDPTGKTISIAYKDERAKVLGILQSLTSDRLFVDKTGKVQVASFGEGEFAAGTALVRALVTHKNDVSIYGKSVLEYPHTPSGGSAITLGTTEIPLWEREKGTGIAVQKEAPDFIVLGHELIHSLHMFNKKEGKAPFTQTSEYKSGKQVRSYTERISGEEAKTVHTGQGPRVGVNEITENDLRREHGIAERVFYSGPKDK